MREDVKKLVDFLEELRKELKEEDLYEFFMNAFAVSSLLLEKLPVLERLSELSKEFEVSEETMLDFLESVLDNVVWRNEKELRSIAEEFRKGLWLRLDGEIYEGVKEKYLRRVREIMRAFGASEEEAVHYVMREILERA